MSHDDITRRYPVLSVHWPGFPTVEAEAPLHIRDLQLQRDVKRLHALGPRTTYELLREIGCQHQCMTFVEYRARHFAALDPAVVARLGGDQFPSPPLREAS